MSKWYCNQKFLRHLISEHLIQMCQSGMFTRFAHCLRFAFKVPTGQFFWYFWRSRLTFFLPQFFLIICKGVPSVVAWKTWKTCGTKSCVCFNFKMWLQWKWTTEWFKKYCNDLCKVFYFPIFPIGKKPCGSDVGLRCRPGSGPKSGHWVQVLEAMDFPIEIVVIFVKRLPEGIRGVIRVIPKKTICHTY